MSKKVVGNISKQNNPGLQKFTNLLADKTLEELVVIRNNNPGRVEELFLALYDELSYAINNKGNIDSCFNKIIKLQETAGDKELDSLKNQRWEVNEELIQTYTHNYIIDKRRTPSVTELSKRTGLSRTTIHNHIRHRGESLLSNDSINTLKTLVPTAVATLFKIGIEGNTKALNSFLNYVEPKPGGDTVINHNYIQINNLKVNADLIKQLPNATLVEIETLINTSLKEIA